MDLITLSDLPELAGDNPKPTSRIVIGRLDNRLRDPRYGKFAITQPMVDSWKRNLDGVFGGQVSMDFDHSSDRGNGTKAACWVKSINQAGNLITADVEFTKQGARAVRNGDYKYTSPTFVENYVDEHGEKHGPALIGGALTNRPVLRKGMPTLSLSKDEFDEEISQQLARSSSHPPDSRGQMELTRSDLATSLGLDPNADSDTVLAAACKLLAGDTNDDGNTKPTTAAADAGKSGKKAKKLGRGKKSGKGTVTLSAEDLATLMTGSNAGLAAQAQLAEERFDTAWTKALSEGRAAPSQEENLKALFALDADLAIKTLDSFVPIVPTRAAGASGATPGAPGANAPDGFDQERYDLHRQATERAKTLAVEHHVSLDEAYALAAIELDEQANGNPGGAF